MSAPDSFVPSPAPLHLAVALDGAGWHPAAWREPGALPAERDLCSLSPADGDRILAEHARSRAIHRTQR